MQYAQGKLLWLAADQEDWREVSTEGSSKVEDPKEELVKRNKKISFEVALKCIAIIRYVGEHSVHVSLGITSKILNSYDFPAIFAQLIDNPPWLIRQDNGKVILRKLYTNCLMFGKMKYTR